ncbi:unnamed protein product [Closterium sp. NIES-53]
MAENTSAGAGESSAQDRSGSQDSGVSVPRGARTNQGSLIKEILEEDFRRRQLRGGDDGSSGYGMQGNRRGRGRGFGGAGRGAKKDDDSNDQQGGTGWGRGAKSGRGGKSGAGGKMKGSCWYCEKEWHPWFLCYKKPDGWTPQNRHQDGGALRNRRGCESTYWTTATKSRFETL